MKKQQLSVEQKRLDTDIWIIALVTFGVFLFYATTGKQLMMLDGELRETQTADYFST